MMRKLRHPEARLFQSNQHSLRRPQFLAGERAQPSNPLLQFWRHLALTDAGTERNLNLRDRFARGRW